MKYFMKQLFIVFFIFFNLSLSAQNLAPNPSFEDTVMCPNLGGQVDRAKFWYTVQNTPDYFHSCFIKNLFIS